MVTSCNASWEVVIQWAKSTWSTWLFPIHHTVVPRFKPVSMSCDTRSWACVSSLQTQASAYHAGSSLWKIWTRRCKSLIAPINTCFGENSPFKNRHADYDTSFLISWCMKVPSVNMRSACLPKAQSSALSLPERSERAFFHVYIWVKSTLKEAEQGPNKESEESNWIPLTPMLFLILTPFCYMTSDNFLYLVTEYTFGFLKLWQMTS